MEKRASWWLSPNLYPLWTCLAFVGFIALIVAVQWVEHVLDRRWMSKELVQDLIHYPILPVEFLFGGYQRELWAHWNQRATPHEPELLFDAACYTLSCSIYRELWRQVRGRRSTGSFLLWGFLLLLFAIQLFVARGWEIPSSRGIPE